MPLRSLITAYALLAGFVARAAEKGDGLTGGDDFLAHYQVDIFTTDHGLPQNSINATVQTPDGYLWVTTWNGLARFDGVRFTVFDPSNSPGLPSSRLTALLSDSSGALWILTEEHEL